MNSALVERWQERIRVAASTKAPLRIRGGGTKDFYGEPGAGEVLDTTEYAGILDYDPTELVITARAGTPLAELETAMAKCGQMLAFEPPHFGEGATLGGAIAAGLSGPRRAFAGAARDVVLGVRILDGSGEDLTFGGRVMKNVAGFDVARLMTGAMGTLGVLIDLSLKCLPVPKTETTVTFDLAPADALRRVNEWGGKPVPISATCYHAGRLAIRLSGAVPAVEAAARHLAGAPMSDDAAFWRAVREQTLPFFQSALPLWRLSVRSTAPPCELAGEQVIEWGGALRWLAATTAVNPEAIRAWAMAHGGHATLFRAEGERAGVFAPLPEPIAALHRRLKSTFDPAGILNPGRLYSAF